MNRSILVLISALFLAGPAWPQNLIVNGDFQAGDTGFTSDYTSSDDLQAELRYVVTPDPGPLHPEADSYFDHTFGDETGLMMAINGGGEPDEVVWAQTLSVDPNQTYVFKLWVSSWVAENPAELVVQVNGVPIGLSFFAPGVTAIWEVIEQYWISDSATTATIEIINLSTVGDIGRGNDFALDDISFTALDPACDIELSQSVYTLGETVTAQTWRISNQAGNNVAVELKAWLRSPDVPPESYFNVGATGSLVLPPGFDRDIGPRTLFTVEPDTELGAYEFNCRTMNPTTGATTTLDENLFTVQ